MTTKGPSQAERACVVSTGPLEEPSLLLEMPDPLRFWHGIDAGLVDKWSTGSRPSLFPPLGGRLRLAELILLHLQRRAQLVVHYEASHSVEQLQLHRPRRMEFGQSSDWELSSIPKELMEVHRPRRLLHA